MPAPVALAVVCVCACERGSERERGDKGRGLEGGYARKCKGTGREGGGRTRGSSGSLGSVGESEGSCACASRGRGVGGWLGSGRGCKVVGIDGVPIPHFRLLV